jgi:hypothetical protein
MSDNKKDFKLDFDGPKKIFEPRYTPIKLLDELKVASEPISDELYREDIHSLITVLKNPFKIVDDIKTLEDLDEKEIRIILDVAIEHLEGTKFADENDLQSLRKAPTEEIIAKFEVCKDDSYQLEPSEKVKINSIEKE